MATATRTAAKKPVAPAKAAAKKPAKAAPAKKASAKDASGASERPKGGARRGNSHVPPERRRNYIEVAAYFIAERHGFTPGRELDDWAAAEAEIDRLLEEGLLTP